MAFWDGSSRDDGFYPKREAEVSGCVRAADEIILITFQKKKKKTEKKGKEFGGRLEKLSKPTSSGCRQG